MRPNALILLAVAVHGAALAMVIDAGSDAEWLNITRVADLLAPFPHVHGYNGTGCPRDSVSFVASPDGSVISVLFSAFRATTSQTTLLQQSQCNIDVVLLGQPNTALGLRQLDFRGNALIPSDEDDTASSSVSSSSKYAGSFSASVTTATPNVQRAIAEHFVANTNRNFDSSIVVEPIAFTPCGANLTAHIECSLEASKSSANAPQNVDLSLESIEDLNQPTGFQYQLLSQTC